MMEPEMKNQLIDTYSDLLQIKAAGTETNEELEKHLKITKFKLSLYGIDMEPIEKAILGTN